jgi:hypothetical protein
MKNLLSPQKSGKPSLAEKVKENLKAAIEAPEKGEEPSPQIKELLKKKKRSLLAPTSPSLSSLSPSAEAISEEDI